MVSTNQTGEIQGKKSDEVNSRVHFHRGINYVSNHRIDNILENFYPLN